MHLMKPVVLALLAGSLLAFVACGGGDNNNPSEPSCRLVKIDDNSVKLLCGKEEFTIKNGTNGKSGKDGDRGPKGEAVKGEQGPPGRDGEDGDDANCEVTRSADRLTAVIKCGKETYAVRLGDDIRAGTGCTIRKIDCGMVQMKCGTTVYNMGESTCKSYRIYERDQKTNKNVKLLKNGSVTGAGDELSADKYYIFQLYDKYTPLTQRGQPQMMLFSNTSCTVDSHCSAAYCDTLRRSGRFNVSCTKSSDCVTKKAGTVCYNKVCYQALTDIRCSSSSQCVAQGSTVCLGSSSTTRRCYTRVARPVACTKSSDCTSKKVGNTCINKFCYSSTTTTCKASADCTKVKGICSGTTKKLCYVRAFQRYTCKSSAECVTKKAGNTCSSGYCHYRHGVGAKCTSSGSCGVYGGTLCSGTTAKKCYFKNDVTGYRNCYEARALLRPRCEYSPFTPSRYSPYRCIWADRSTSWGMGSSTVTHMNKRCKTAADCGKVTGRTLICVGASGSTQGYCRFQCKTTADCQTVAGKAPYCYKLSGKTTGECRTWNPAYYGSSMPYRTTCNWLRYSAYAYRTNTLRHTQYWRNLPKVGTQYEFSGFVSFFDGKKQFFRYKWFKDADIQRCVCPTGKRFDSTSRTCK